MKPMTRWIIVLAVLIVIALVIWLLTQGGEPQAPQDGGAMSQQAAPSPPTAPPAPKPAEAVVVQVLFDFDRSVVRPADAGALDRLAATFSGGAFERVDAIGHADRIGSESYNMTLSQRRADAVGQYLAGKGVDAAKVRIEASGEGNPVTGDSCRNLGAENGRNRRLVECLQPDRRVQVTLVPAR